MSKKGKVQAAAGRARRSGGTRLCLFAVWDGGWWHRWTGRSLCCVVVRSIVRSFDLFVRSIDCSFVDCSLCCVVLCGVVLRCVVLLFRLVRSFFRSFVRSSFHRFVVRTVGASVRRSVCYLTWDGFRLVTLATWLHRFVRCIGSLVLGQQFGALVRWRCCLPLFGCWDQATTRWVTESKTEAAVGTTFRCVMFRKLAGL